MTMPSNEEFLFLDTNVWGKVLSRDSRFGLKGLLTRLEEQGAVLPGRFVNLAVSPMGILEILGITLLPLRADWDAFVSSQLRVAHRSPAQQLAAWNRIYDAAQEKALELLGDYRDLAVIKRRALEYRDLYLGPQAREDFNSQILEKLEASSYLHDLVFSIKTEILLGSAIAKRDADIRQSFEVQCLSFVFIGGFGQPIFRTAKSIFETLLPAMRRTAVSSGDRAQIDDLKATIRAMEHKRVADLVDSEFIHVATVGKIQTSPSVHAKVITFDPPEKLKRKVSIYQSIVQHSIRVLRSNPEFDQTQLPILKSGEIVFLSDDFSVTDIWKVPEINTESAVPGT